MGSFADDLAGDLDAVFFDEDFFSSRHMVDGKEMSVFLDNYSLEERAAAGRKRDGVNRDEQLLFVKEADVGRKLKIGAVLELDGVRMFIHHAQLDGGVYRVILGRNQI